jgi:hypothetical protein
MKAFPTTKPLDSWGDPNAGMDLRDYFAAKAMQALLTTFEFKGNQITEVLPINAYQMADAMMKARESK